MMMVMMMMVFLVHMLVHRRMIDWFLLDVNTVS